MSDEKKKDLKHELKELIDQLLASRKVPEELKLGIVRGLEESHLGGTHEISLKRVK